MNARGLLSTVGWLVIAALATLAAGHGANAEAQDQPKAAAPNRFEVASVRLVEDFDKLPRDKQKFYESPSGAGQFAAQNISLEGLIGVAFGIDTDLQLAGKPEWFDDAHYDVAAKPEGDVGLSYEQLRPYLQQLLQERFHLTYHRESRNFEGYALVTAKGGSKLKMSKSDFTRAQFRPGVVQGWNEPIKVLAQMVGYSSGKPVSDRTGLKGNYDFDLRFATLEETDSALPSIFTAVQEQLGLKLVKQMVPVEMLVIDHVDRVPTEN
jgi:uncharacterized protein (TIGR03435 family)